MTIAVIPYFTSWLDYQYWYCRLQPRFFSDKSHCAQSDEGKLFLRRAWTQPEQAELNSVVLSFRWSLALLTPIAVWLSILWLGDLTWKWTISEGAVKGASKGRATGRDGHYRISNLPNPNVGNIGLESGSFIRPLSPKIFLAIIHWALRDRRCVLLDVRPQSDLTSQSLCFYR